MTLPIPTATPATPRQRHAWSAFLAARFSPQDAFGLGLTIGVALFVAASLAFGVLAEDVVHGAAITHVDAWVAQWFHARATPGVTRAMLVVTDWNSLAGSSAMAAVLALWFWRRGRHDWMRLTVVAMAGGELLNVVLKHVFQRARPHFDHPLLATLDTYSFPSGHTAASTVFYGLLAYWLCTRVHAWALRVAAVAAAVGMVCVVALSRVYLGEHYLSDVLAAVLESCAWLALCITAVSTSRRAQDLRRRQGGAA